MSYVFSTRIISLQKKLAKIEKREADETAALENMVQMVEKNLELTTVRGMHDFSIEALACRSDNSVGFYFEFVSSQASQLAWYYFEIFEGFRLCQNEKFL